MDAQYVCYTFFFYLLDNVMVFLLRDCACLLRWSIYTYTIRNIHLDCSVFLLYLQKIRIYDVVHTYIQQYILVICVCCVLFARIGSCDFVCLCLCVLAHFQRIWCSRITIASYHIRCKMNLLLKIPDNFF